MQPKKRASAKRPRRSESQLSRTSEQPSGAFSQDPILDAAELFDVLEREENVHRVLEAMREFHRLGDAQLLARAVAVFVRSARARNEPVESVLGALDTIADALERDAQPGFRQRDTPMRHLLLRGVLLAFYGIEAVEREVLARAERRARQSERRRDS